MKVGDLVVIKKVSVTPKSTTWYKRYARENVLMLVLEHINFKYVRVQVCPPGMSCSIVLETRSLEVVNGTEV